MTGDEYFDKYLNETTLLFKAQLTLQNPRSAHATPPQRGPRTPAQHA